MNFFKHLRTVIKRILIKVFNQRVMNRDLAESYWKQNEKCKYVSHNIFKHQPSIKSRRLGQVLTVRVDSWLFRMEDIVSVNQDIVP